MRKMIKVSDYIIDYFHKKGIKNVFIISGGGVIHITDSVGRGKINYVCNHHEQASAIAAEGYSRITQDLGACIVTSGPGGTNAITGVLGAWLDSIPMIVVSGQIKRETLGAGSKLRQLGDQEINIVDIVRPITKYSAVVMEPNDIKYHLEKAFFIAKSGRPGPVWLDVPLDVQGAFVNVKNLRKFTEKEIHFSHKTEKQELRKLVSLVIEKLKKAKRPVLLIGNGVRLAKAAKDVLSLINLLKIPTLVSFTGFDLVATDNKYYFGHPGTIGQRSANFAIQNSDFLLILGSRLNIRMLGYNYKSFARKAYKVMVDIDNEELNKKTVRPGLKINYDLKDFIGELIGQLKKNKLNLSLGDWLEKNKEWKNKYPIVLSEYWREEKYINSYCFIDTLSKHLKPTDILALANATAAICTYQALKFPQGLRIIVSSGCAAMGYGLPVAIGACFANDKKQVICLEGDGSLQLNIQELQTVVHHKLPVKIFVYNNGGYLSIKSTQEGLFNGRLVASEPSSGVTFPNLKKIAGAYGIKYVKMSKHSEMNKKINEILSFSGPVICEIMMSPSQRFMPKSGTKKLPDGTFVSRPLEDMYPYLDRKEFNENMIVKPLDQ